jgi:putative cofactor-binding repeat protein
LDGPDFYPTPRWATFALIDNEKFSSDIWECACGDGTMSKVLKETGCAVLISDLYDRGYGEVALDFLTSTRYADNIVTNPPFNCAEGFVTSGVKLARKKFAQLLRLAFLEGANRARTIFSEHPPSRVWVFSERITFYPTGAKVRGTGTTAYAWLVWDKDAPERAVAGIMVGWGAFMRDVSVTGNVVRDCRLGISVSVVNGAGTAAIAGNLISGSPRGAIVGMDHAKAVTGDLSQEPTRYANLQISGNRVR